MTALNEIAFYADKKGMNEVKVEENPKAWTKPVIEEIPLSCEISMYSSAELPEDVDQI